MLIAVFQGAVRTSPIDVAVTLKAGGPGLSALFTLYDANDPSNRVEIKPSGQSGASASWTLSPAYLGGCRETDR